MKPSLTRRGAIALGLGALSLAGCAHGPPERHRRPNILLILADDLGWSDLGCFGSEIRTPALDRLAANGLRFGEFINAGRCAPTRATLLTGVTHHEAGIGAYTSRPDRPIEPGPYQGFLDPGVPTLAERLRPAGYRSYAVGKWHVGERPEHWPTRRGFDRYFGLISGTSSYFALSQDGHRERRMIDGDQDWQPPTAGFYATDAYTQRALDDLSAHKRQHGDAPFFMYLAYTAPHWPIHALPEDLKRYDGVYARGPAALRAARRARAEALELIDRRYRETGYEGSSAEADPLAMAAHAAMIDRMDQGIARIIARLEADGALDNTLIIFLSDNGASGEDPRSRGLDDPAASAGSARSYRGIGPYWAWAANTPYRHSKGTSWQGGLASAAIVHWPAAMARPGRLSPSRRHILDIVPTVLDAARLAPLPAAPQAPRGASLLPEIAGLAGPGSRPLFHEHDGWRAWYADGFKALYDKPGARWHLFDLQADPAESRDLAGTDSQRLATMIDDWRAIARTVQVKQVNEGEKP